MFAARRPSTLLSGLKYFELMRSELLRNVLAASRRLKPEALKAIAKDHNLMVPILIP